MQTYVLAGTDVTAKDQEISNLKKKVLQSPDTALFDYEVLHAHKLDVADLKRSLITLPAVSPQRLILIRECQRLDAANKKILAEFVPSKENHAVLVLDFDEFDLKDSFLKSLGAAVKLIDFRKPAPPNVFDLTKAISLRRSSDALKILDQLLDEGIHPLQIMGGLVWFWGNVKGRLGFRLFEDGLLALQEADLNIKRSRLRPEHALEMVVVKLASAEIQ